MEWLLFIVFAILIGASTAGGGLVQPLFELGPLRMDWRDIIALAIVVIVAWALYADKLSVQQALAILGGLLVGKLVFR
jgi:hypothetical protein